MEHISLDGVIQHDEGEGFAHGNWTTPYRTPAGLAAVMEAYGSPFNLLRGRRTYDAWADFWPQAGNSPIASSLNAATKYVATRRPDSLAWGPAQDLGADIMEGIRRLKATEGPDLVVCSSSSSSPTLTSTLLEQGLANEVVLGRGKRFFSDQAAPCELAFVSTQATATGVRTNSCRYVGALRA